MRIYIPTLSRAGKVETLKYLDRVKDKVSLVVQSQEFELYSKLHDIDIIKLPENIKTIAPTREWIINYSKDDIIFMADDDLKFFKRKNKNDWHLRYMNPEEADDMIKLLEDTLAEEAHAGLSPRAGNNQYLDEIYYNRRYMRFYGYNLKFFNNIKLNRIPVMEDFDIALQLLENGFRSVIYYSYAQDHIPSNTKGGCSNWRTLELHAKSALKLKELHPGFVDVVKKKTKTSWGGQERLDVVIKWA